MNLSGAAPMWGRTPKGFNPKPPNRGDLMQTVPANADVDLNTAECGHPLDAYCTCMADAMEAECDAEYGSEADCQF